MEYWQLEQRRGLTLEAKIRLSRKRIREWYEHWEGDVYCAFSGGVDSTVLLHLIRAEYPDIKGVFSNTGLEFPELVEFVNNTSNVEIIRPKKSFKQVIREYGYPVISKTQAMAIRKLRTQNLSEKYRLKLLHGDERGTAGKLSDKWHYLLDAPFPISEMCCDVLKKRPFKEFETRTGLKPYVGTLAGESRQRTLMYLKNGCNAFDAKKPASTPISFWTDEDIWEYIKKFNVPYATIYDKGYNTTGCIFCMFGCHMEEGENRFQKLKKTHPHLYEYCMNKLDLKEVLDYINVPY